MQPATPEETVATIYGAPNPSIDRPLAKSEAREYCCHVQHAYVVAGGARREVLGVVSYADLAEFIVEVDRLYVSRALPFMSTKEADQLKEDAFREVLARRNDRA